MDFSCFTGTSDNKDVTPSSPSRHLKQWYVDMLPWRSFRIILMLQLEQVGSHRINRQWFWWRWIIFYGVHVFWFSLRCPPAAGCQRSDSNFNCCVLQLQVSTASWRLPEHSRGGGVAVLTTRTAALDCLEEEEEVFRSSGEGEENEGDADRGKDAERLTKQEERVCRHRRLGADLDSLLLHSKI